MAELKQYFVGAMLLSLVVIVSALWITSWDEQYKGYGTSSAERDSFSAVFDKSANITEDLKVQRNTTLSAQEAEISTGEVKVTGVLSAITTPLQSIGLAIGMIDSAGEFFGIPISITVIFAVILAGVITFAIINVIWSRTRT